MDVPRCAALGVGPLILGLVLTGCAGRPELVASGRVDDPAFAIGVPALDAPAADLDAGFTPAAPTASTLAIGGVPHAKPRPPRL